MSGVNRKIPYRQHACVILLVNLIVYVLWLIGICVAIDFRIYTSVALAIMILSVMVGFILFCFEVWAVGMFFKAAKSSAEPMQMLRPARRWMIVQLCNIVCGRLSILIHLQAWLLHSELVVRLICFAVVAKFTRELKKVENS